MLYHQAIPAVRDSVLQCCYVQGVFSFQKILQFQEEENKRVSEMPFFLNKENNQFLKIIRSGYRVDWPYCIRIQKILNMGCQACKIYQENAFVHFFQLQSNNDVSHDAKGLLQSKQQKVWIENLKMIEAPDPNFWEDHKHLNHSCFIQIKKDITRSFPGSEFFSDPSNILRFQQLLKQFALYFPKVGYTQGLNFLAGYIILAGFNDQKSFQILVQLAMHENLLLLGLYEDRFPLNRLYCSLFWNLLEKKLPKTASIIKEAGVPDQIWIFQWFMSFFLYSFPLDFVKPFFNYIINKKQLSMVLIALGIISCLKNDIKSLENPDQFQFFQFVNNLKSIEYCNQKINVQKVINFANSITHYELQTALSEIKLDRNNIYHAYFWKNQRRKQIWNALYTKANHERKMFKFNPRSIEYRRDKNMVEHLQRLIQQKCRLYKSRAESKYSNSFRTSNYTIDLEQLEIEQPKENYEKYVGTLSCSTPDNKQKKMHHNFGLKKQTINLKEHQQKKRY